MAVFCFVLFCFVLFCFVLYFFNDFMTGDKKNKNFSMKGEMSSIPQKMIPIIVENVKKWQNGRILRFFVVAVGCWLIDYS